jgi:TetR/AcrR family transcriptional repressor of nem operon
VAEKRGIPVGGERREQASARRSESGDEPSATATAAASGAAAAPFATTLRQRQKDAGVRRKGERTRDRLKVAAVQVLEERGYLALRVSDICKRARVSTAVFYLYFKNKEEITLEVLTEFVHETGRLVGVSGTERTLFESMCQANLQWASSVRANTGLMRCLLQLSDQVPEFKKLNEKLNHEWFVHVTQRLVSRFPNVRVDKDALLLAVYALGGMMDDISRKILVDRDEHLQQVIWSIAPTDEALAEFLAVLWYRALFGSDPPLVHHACSRELLSLRSAGSPAVARG